MTRRLPLFMFGALSLSLGAMAQDVQFQKDVLPILENRCFECHRTAHNDGGRMRRPKGGVTMDTKAGIEAGKRGKPIVVPGKPDDSPLYVLTQLPEDDEDHMPPKDKKPPLTKASSSLASARKKSASWSLSCAKVPLKRCWNWPPNWPPVCR